MSQNKILQELSKNKLNQKIGTEIFGVPVSKEDIKEGLPLKEILKKMREASKEKLFNTSDNASFC